MSTPSLATPPDSAASSPPAAGSGTAAAARRHGGWLIALGVLVVAVVAVQWARTRPGFDPYGWLVWGHQTIHGSLDTNAAPSWKPLPWLFTTPFALLGRFEMKAWMFLSVAVSLSGIVFAARIALRLTDAPPERRWAGWIAAVFAGACVLGIQNAAHYILSAQSDPMIVSLCLGAIDAHLSGRVRSTIVLAVLAGLGRPEVWAFLGLYTLWAWGRRPESRPWLIGGWVVTFALWFGIPALTSRSPFVAANNAMGSGRRLTNDQIFGTVKRFLAINELPVELAALIAVGLAVWRRQRTVLALTAATLLWVVIEIAFALHGWPGLVRYMFEAGGVVIVLAGVAVGWLLCGVPSPSRRPRVAPPLWIGAAIVAVLVVSMAAEGVGHARDEHIDLRQQRARTAQIAALTPALNRYGGIAQIKRCGVPVVRLSYQTTAAYTLGVNVSKIGFKLAKALSHHVPVVQIVPAPSGPGWVIRGFNQTAAGCRALPH
ncbi:MAG TPA: hypothetical protein VFN55_14625 [Solirubrobacteraceae bacterium]|nr:hypothetical protein [Solirubrobacteraceae bacterium]